MFPTASLGTSSSKSLAFVRAWPPRCVQGRCQTESSASKLILTLLSPWFRSLRTDHPETTSDSRPTQDSNKLDLRSRNVGSQGVEVWGLRGWSWWPHSSWWTNRERLCKFCLSLEASSMRALGKPCTRPPLPVSRIVTYTYMAKGLLACLFNEQLLCQSTPLSGRDLPGSSLVFETSC